MLGIFCGLRQGVVHCGFIFSDKESTPAALDPQLGKDPKSQFSLKKKQKKRQNANTMVESYSYKTW